LLNPSGRGCDLQIYVWKPSRILSEIDFLTAYCEF
jgi:hypothetical protein